MGESTPQLDTYLARTLDADVSQLCDFLKIRSISTRPENRRDVTDAAHWAANYLQSAGLTTEVWSGHGNEVVFAEVPAADPSASTVLVYGHYDVQPEGDVSLWTSPPFEPCQRDGNIFARGVADNKGQVFLQMRAAKAWLAVAGNPPVNIKFLIEGEEEIGSPSLPQVLESHRERLGCDVVAISDTPLFKPDRPALSLGTRGNLGLEVTVIGPSCDLHSGIYGGSVPNPIAVLTRMLAALHDENGRITVPGYYDGVAPIPAFERDAWRELDFDDAAYAARLGCGLSGESGYSTLERRWGRPTLEFNGITGGYQGPGSNTIVPSRASVKITGRMVPDQDPEGLTANLRTYLEQLAPDSVRLEFMQRKMGARAYHIDSSHPGLEAARSAMRDVYGVEPVHVREGLSLPILTSFKRVLGVDTILLGFCDPDCQAHSFDEFFAIEDLQRGSMTAARFLELLRDVPRAGA